MERVKTLLSRKEPVKWLFYGDSITHGALHTWGWRDYTEHFRERVRFELGRTMDIVLNTAISGNTTADLLESFPWRAESFKPDAVFVMIGMNDSVPEHALAISPEQFVKNLELLADKFAAMHTLVIMQTTCPVLPGAAKGHDTALDQYMEITRNFSIRRKLPLIDHYHYWRENEPLRYFWMSNAIHPNQYGHAVFAHYLFKGLGIFDPGSHTCRLHTP